MKVLLACTPASIADGYFLVLYTGLLYMQNMLDAASAAFVRNLFAFLCFCSVVVALLPLKHPRISKYLAFLI